MPLPQMVKRPVEPRNRPALLAGPLLEQVAVLVRQQFGLDYPGPRQHDLARLLSLAALEQSTEAPERWLQQLAAGHWSAPLRQQLIGVLTVGETYFFRDPEFFRSLTDLLQTMLMRCRANGEANVRIWSAGCCSGEELYSVLITLDRLLLRQWSGWQLQLLGTDLNPAFLQRARQAEYGSYALRHVDADTRQLYFTAQDRRWCLNPDWRHRAKFAELNLATGSYPDPGRDLIDFDLILCRNVLMYFAADLAGEVLKRLHACLKPDGSLVLSAVEAGLASAAGLTGYWQAGGYLIPARQPTPLPTLPAQPMDSSARVHPVTDLDHRQAVFGHRQVANDAEAKRPSVARQKAAITPVPAASPPVATQASTVPPPSFAPYWQQAQQAMQAGTPLQALAAVQAALALPTLSRAQQFELCLLLARVHCNLHDLSAASESLERCRQLQALDARPYWLHALVAEQRGDTADALQAVRKALYLEPDFILAHLLHGQLLMRQGARERARRSLQTCRALLADLPDAQLVPESEGTSVAQLRSLCCSLLQEPTHES